MIHFLYDNWKYPRTARLDHLMILVNTHAVCLVKMVQRQMVEAGFLQRFPVLLLYL